MQGYGAGAARSTGDTASAFQGLGECWGQLHTTLLARSATAEEQALLLCRLVCAHSGLRHGQCNGKTCGSGRSMVRARLAPMDDDQSCTPVLHHVLAFLAVAGRSALLFFAARWLSRHFSQPLTLPHACSLLLGFGLDAFVCVGRLHSGAVHMWCITRGSLGSATMHWEPASGGCVVPTNGLVCEHFPSTEVAMPPRGREGHAGRECSLLAIRGEVREVRRASNPQSALAATLRREAPHAVHAGTCYSSQGPQLCPYLSVGSVFNHRSVYANCQVRPHRSCNTPCLLA